MVDLELARSKVLSHVNGDFHLSEGKDCIVLIDKETLEFEDSWVFYYNSEKFLQTGDFDFMLMGNKPVGVSKVTGQVSYIRGDIDARDALLEAGLVK